MTTSSGISASMASMMASLANFGGTKMIDTSAPVFSIASLTPPKTGSLTIRPPLSSCVTVVPALRALTPPTIWVPALSIRAVCTVASLPVMPWTMTLLSLVRKIAIESSLLCLVSTRCARLRRACDRHGSGARQLGGLVGGLVHRRHRRHQWVVGLGQDATALFDVVAVEPHHQRLVGLGAEDFQRLDDPGGHRVA